MFSLREKEKRGEEWRQSARAGGASPYRDGLRRCIATNSGIAVLASRFSFAVVSYSNDGERMRHPTSCPRSSTMLCSRSAPLSASGCTIVHAATRDMWRAREAHTRLFPTAATSAEFIFVKVCRAQRSSLSLCRPGSSSGLPQRLCMKRQA